uniref:VWA domain-containing protein n=1 Tax=Eiseniibacteriota bacterium TaxID=2212470 RepID=A0A832I419_UNCEI
MPEPALRPTVNDVAFHLAPNAPWLPLALLSAGAVALALWAYRFAIPPLPAFARRALATLRAAALLALLWLLAQPVLLRARGGEARVVVLLDRSASMDLPAAPNAAGGAPARSRAAAAERAVAALRSAWRGRAALEVVPFASRLAADSADAGPRGATALGDALAALGRAPAGEAAGAVVVVSDGAVNAGEDPVSAARALGLPVHAVLIGDPGGDDRAIEGIEASAAARVGEATPVRVRVRSTEPRGTPLPVELLDGGRVIGRSTAIAPGGGEVTVEFRPVPARPGLAVWTARVDSLAGEVTAANNARQVAVEVAPGRLGVVIVSAGLNWDLTFVRRALAGDSSLAVTTWVRERDGFRALERRRAGAPGEADLRGAAVVVLDALDPASVSPGFDRALAAFVRGGGGLLLFGGPAPGVSRFRRGALGAELGVELDAAALGRAGTPVPGPEARELLQWEDDAARAEQAWRAAAPLADLAPVTPGAGDRVLVGAAGGGPPLLLARRVGRGQALFVNGTGTWRWSLAAHDDRSGERGRRLWRRVARWLAEPVQGEPLRVRPERWLTAGGERVRLFATLQDERFAPVAGAEVVGEARDAAGRARPVAFEPREAGAYVAALDDLPPGRWTVLARATRGGRELGRATAEFAVDRWSLEASRTLPDSATLAAVAAASGGRMSAGADVAAWARGLESRALARGRSESLRLWESPWLFALVVGALSVEWAWRRRRGLP